MKAAEHTVSPEELMAYLDGELPEERHVTVHAHMLQCDPCGRLMSELRQVSRDAALWEVEAAPASLSTPPVPAADVPAQDRWEWLGWRKPSIVWQFAGVSLMVIVGLTALMSLRPGESTVRVIGAPAEPAAVAGSGGLGPISSAGREEPKPTSPQRLSGTQPTEALASAASTQLDRSRGPQVVRTASLAITTPDFEAARPAVERIVRDAGGFIGQLQLFDASDTSRTLRATLRVPSPRLDEALASLRQIGRVLQETQEGDDVSAQIRDLGARLVNLRNTETRLSDVLLKRTGDVGDVLQVEREIARVRGEIERMEAERAGVEGRVEHATITLQVDEERKATLGLGPLPVFAQFRNALVDGFRRAFESMLDVSLVALRSGPVLVLWTAVLWWPARAIVRARRKRLT